MFRSVYCFDCYLLHIAFVVPPPWPHPNTVSAVPVNRRGVIRMSWTAPVVPTGELPFTDYSIRYQIRGSGTSGYQYMNATQSPAEVTGLHPGTYYRVFIASFNALGRGKYCCLQLETSLIVRTHPGKYNILALFVYLCVYM